MKKQISLILLILTLVFGSFSMGYFLGRNRAQSPVRVSALPQAIPQATKSAESKPTEPPSTETVPETTSVGLININTADQATLMLLPGIGQVLSQRILDYREENGPFESIEELINVSGIGEKRLEALLPFASVGG